MRRWYVRAHTGQWFAAFGEGLAKSIHDAYAFTEAEIAEHWEHWGGDAPNSGLTLRLASNERDAQRPSQNTIRRKRKELRTLELVQRAGVPKAYQIALQGMVDRLRYFLRRYDS